MSGSSTDSMDVEFVAGLCENLAPAGMDGRESTRIRTPVKTPKRFRSASSPFASPMSDAMLTDSPKVMDSPLSPLVGSSPISGGPSKGLHRYGFKVVRKRRATVQETSSKHAGITGVHSLACSSPIRKTPKREGSLSRAGVRMDFAQPFPPREKRMTEQDYVLQEDNLVSSPDDEVFASLSEAPIVTDLIKRRPTNLPGNDRRPSALISRRNQSRDHKLGESPVSYRTKRCLSLCSPGMMNSRMRGLRERNRSVNDYNIPKKDLNPALMDQPDLTGDFKRMLSLPSTTSGKHQDLKYINGETLVDLQNGLHNVEATIIDARYPYEYKGGHIKGAINLYTVEMVEDYFFGPNGLAQWIRTWRRTKKRSHWIVEKTSDCISLRIFIGTSTSNVKISLKNGPSKKPISSA